MGALLPSTPPYFSLDGGDVHSRLPSGARRARRRVLYARYVRTRTWHTPLMAKRPGPPRDAETAGGSHGHSRTHHIRSGRLRNLCILGRRHGPRSRSQSLWDSVLALGRVDLVWMGTDLRGLQVN